MGGHQVPSRSTRRAYFLGTNFCGSTVFGQALGAHSRVTYLGEVDRLVGFTSSVFTDEPEPPCHHCARKGEQCPVWTAERRQVAKETRFGELMSYFADQFGATALVDGSKHPSWLREVLADGSADHDSTVVFVTARSPFAFSHSYRRRTNCQIWEAANIWRDVYSDAVRTVTRAGLPLAVVRYEHFAASPEETLRRACSLLGVAYEPEMLYFRSVPSHDIGGNQNVLLPRTDDGGGVNPNPRSRTRALRQLVRPTDPYAGQPFGGWVDDSWQAALSAGELEQVLQTPGLVELANLLGYEMSREVLAWQAFQTADR